jgi:hypothetical protein
MFENFSEDDRSKYTTQKNELEKRLDKLKFILKLNILKNQLYLQIVLNKIELAKKLFIMEV